MLSTEDSNREIICLEYLLMLVLIWILIWMGLWLGRNFYGQLKKNIGILFDKKSAKIIKQIQIWLFDNKRNESMQ